MFLSRVRCGVCGVVCAVILLLTIVVVRITSGDDVMDFVRDGSLEEWYYSPSATEGVSRFGEYRDIRIVPVWTAPFAVPPSLSRRGTPFRFYFFLK